MKKVFFLILFSNYILFSQNISVTKSKVFNDLKVNNKLEHTLSLDDGSIMTIRSYSMSSANVYPTFRVSHYNSEFKLLEKTDFKHGNALILGAFVKEKTIFLIEQRIVERFINNKTITGVRIFVLSSLVSSLNFEEKELLSLGDYNIHDYFKGYTKLYSTDEQGKVIKKYAHLYSSTSNNFFTLVFDIKNKDFRNKAIISFNNKFEILYTKTIRKSDLGEMFLLKWMEVNDTNGMVYSIGHPLDKRKESLFYKKKFNTEVQLISKDTIIKSIIDTSKQTLSALKLFHNSTGLSCVGLYSNLDSIGNYGVFRINFDDQSLDKKMILFNKVSKEFFKKKIWPNTNKFVLKKSFFVEDGSIIFNTEETVEITNSNSSSAPIFNQGGISLSVGYNITYHEPRDLTSLKISENGIIIWAKSIVKKGFTYKSLYRNKNVFFIMNLSDKTSILDDGRLKVYKTGKNKAHLYAIIIDKNGKISTEKLIDNKDIVIPFLIDDGTYSKENDELTFLGSKKKSKKSQLIKLSINL